MKGKKDAALWFGTVGAICMAVSLGLLTGCVSNSSLRGGPDKDIPVIVKLRLKTQPEVDDEDKKYGSMNWEGKFAAEQAFHFVREQGETNPCDEFDYCSHEKIFYDDPRISDGKDKSADLFIVEFDDRGRLYYSEQMNHLFEFLKTAMTNPRPNCTESKKQDEAEKPCFDDISLVVAVHGWRHNASFQDRNLRELRQALYSAVMMEQGTPHLNPSHKPRKVVGVYVGWRGAFIDENASIPLLDQIRVPFADISLSDATLKLLAVTTFWDRKRIAMDVALGSTRELFSRLGHLRDYVNTPAMKRQDEKLIAFDRPQGWYEECKGLAIVKNGRCLPMRTLIVGHSFGSLAIYNAISASLIESVTAGIDVSPPSVPPSLKYCLDNATEILSSHADLIVLVNPAFEGARYEPLYQASLNRMRTGGYSCNQHPVLAIITGTTDWATKVAFPIGRWFSTRFTSVSPKGRDGESLDDLEPQERNAERHTVGHIPRYMTHFLDIFPDTYIDQRLGNDQISEEDSRDMTRCLIGDWRKVSKELAGNGSGTNRLERAILNVRNRWKSPQVGTPLPARAFCGRLRLSLAMHETEEGMKDPLDSLPDHSEASGPWTNQLPSSRPESDGNHVQNYTWTTRNPYNPIWVIRTKDDRIIDGHSGYLNPYMVGFIHQLYRDAVSVPKSLLQTKPGERKDLPAK